MKSETQNTYIDLSTLTKAPVDIVCPSCRSNQFVVSSENDGEADVSCAQCDAKFSIENGFLNLVVGERFEDDSGSECLCYEEESNRYTTEHYWIPLFRKMQEGRSEKLRILSIGCGIGREVDMLCDAGFDCVGIDNGNRAKIWPNRAYPNRFIMANGMHLPFEDEAFDVVYCGCVFPHVGVIGDSVNVSENYESDRTALASEMTRVVKQGGDVVVGSPNRTFPFDLFHGRDKGCYTPRYNRPAERFLLSAVDYKKIFYAGGNRSHSLLPVKGYWGFVGSKSSLKGTLLSLPVRFAFSLVSTKLFAFLRGSVISPWIMLRFKK